MDGLQDTYYVAKTRRGLEVLSSEPHAEMYDAGPFIGVTAVDDAFKWIEKRHTERFNRFAYPLGALSITLFVVAMIGSSL